MFLENIVIDAHDPQRLGRFWLELLQAEQLTDSPSGFETRTRFADDAYLDLCFQPVAEPPLGRPRMHVCAVWPGTGAQAEQWILRRGGKPSTPAQAPSQAIGQHATRWFLDPEGNPFSIEPSEARDNSRGGLATVVLASAQPGRDAEFWAYLTGWKRPANSAHDQLRHPSGRGPTLEFAVESQPKGEQKNRWHLDIRLDPGEDPAVLAGVIGQKGGRELHPDWGELPWRVYQDPSGNEFCVLTSH